MTYNEIGFSSNAGSTFTALSNQIKYIYGSSNSAGILDQFFLRVYSGATETQRWDHTEFARAAVYLSSNRELIAQTDPFSGPSGGNIEWVSGQFGPSSISANETYIVAIWGDDSIKTLGIETVAGKYYWWDSGRNFYASSSGDFSLYLPTLDPDFTQIGSEKLIQMYASYLENPTATITNVSGCVASGVSIVTLSAKCTGGPGNVKFYYETGSTGGGTDPSEWRYSSQYEEIVTSGEYLTQQLTDLNPNTSYCYRVYISSNNLGGGEDWFDSTITFGTSAGYTYKEGNSLRIHYSCNQYPANYIDCWATRWDEDNYNVIVETFLSSGARNTLFKNVTPGAVRELYKILGKPTFIDSTYSSGNTLILEPISGYGLSSLREKRIIAVKNISDDFINWEKFHIKIEGTRLDT